MLARLLLAINALFNSPDTTATALVNASLRSVGSIAGHSGNVMELFVQVHCQVWIAQSPLSKSCRATLRQLPLVPI